MGKQTFEKTKKTLGILLLVFFVVSITVTAVSARIVGPTNTSKFGPVSKQNYDKGARDGSDKGYSDGHTAGMRLGDSDCKTGKPNSGGKDVKGNATAKSSSAYDLGYADGYNALYPMGYSIGYTQGYNDCINRGEQNKQGSILTWPNINVTI